MKASEAPEKLYLSKNIYSTYLYQVPDPDDETTVEYTRTDTFIEKACELLARMIWEVTYEDLEGNSVYHHTKMKFIEDFKKYMEGE